MGMTVRQMTAEMIRLKSVPCMDCVAEGKDGIWPACCMQFDHVPERGHKVETVRKCIKFGNEEGFRAEVAKCDVVCSNHHAIRTQNREIPEKTLAKMRASQKILHAKPEFRAKRELHLRLAVDEEHRERSSKNMTANWANPEFRATVKRKRSARKLQNLIRSFDRRAWMEMLIGKESDDTSSSRT